MSTLSANFEIFASIATVGLSATLAAVSLLSHRRLRSPRALFIGLAFLTFVAQGAYLVYQSSVARGSQAWILPMASLDLVILGFLYVALRIR